MIGLGKFCKGLKTVKVTTVEFLTNRLPSSDLPIAVCTSVCGSVRAIISFTAVRVIGDQTVHL
jgi:hypothetical protein